MVQNRSNLVLDTRTTHTHKKMNGVYTHYVDSFPFVALGNHIVK